MTPRKLLFMTGTRADFGKLKALINSIDEYKEFDVYLFVTGMHMLSRYGSTYIEVEKNKRGHIYTFINQNYQDDMDQVLSKTISGFSDYVRELKPDIIFIHGDRVEALAGAIVGSLNNILVAHIEGGELSGTIDESIRHAVTKLSHLHFVANDDAKGRLIRMGESPESIHVIGSPDLDVMASNTLPNIDFVLQHYCIPSKEYSIVLFHPVTTESNDMHRQADALVDALLESGNNYVVIYPNNDKGSDAILRSYKRLEGDPRFVLIPSMRFEFFLTLMKHTHCVIGNSSAGIREAPFYGIPSINLGSRQANRSRNPSIIQVPDIQHPAIVQALAKVEAHSREPVQEFGSGTSAKLFCDRLLSKTFWQTPIQKVFHSD